MLEIVIKDQNNAVSEYQINYEEVKQALATELKKYDKLVVTEEFMQSAKKSRAELNAMKKDLKERLSEIRKAQLKPYEQLKEQYTDKLEQMIDDYVIKIDNQIKEIEKKKIEEKNKQIKEYFDECNKKAQLEIPLNNVFNPKWSNQTYSLSKVKADIDLFFVKVTEDLGIIDSFDDEFVIPLRKLYLACFDMSVVMKNKVEFDNEKQRRLEAEAEAERLRKELAEQKEREDELRRMAETDTAGTGADIPEAECGVAEIPDTVGNDSNENEAECCQYGNDDCENADVQPEAIEDDLTVVNSIPEENIPEATQTHQETQQSNPEINETELEYIEFWVKVTPEQKLMLRNLVLDNHIKCGKVKQKTEQEIADILINHFSNVYCDTCGNEGKDTPCDCCYRKSMLWTISENTAKEIAQEIAK